MYRYLVVCLVAATLSVKGMSNNSPFPSPPQKILHIDVQADGLVIFDRDTLMTDDLAKELQTRFWKSYLGTGRMQDSLEIHFATDASGKIRSTALDAIKEGQSKALNEVAVQKFKRTFENLNSSQKKKLQKLFPILFQQLQ